MMMSLPRLDDDTFLAIVSFQAIHLMYWSNKILIKTKQDGYAGAVEAYHSDEGWKKNGFAQWIQAWNSMDWQKTNINDHLSDWFDFQPS
jgi:hypothetical protein